MRTHRLGRRLTVVTNFRTVDAGHVTAEGAALDEDEQADRDQDRGQQDVTSATQGLGDDRTGGKEPAREAPHRHEHEEQGARIKMSSMLGTANNPAPAR
ncbi:hypothetical protein [Streptomyces sp. NPDC093589]|uniref:hypothetical protein n=1 Tax=Streptomyces sp. NPDC093589 TaxID=3366043 RepID=UPI0038174908